MTSHPNNYPKLHNAAWPGVVGKGDDDANPVIGLDQMLDLTAAAEVDGRKFDGVDIFLFDPHISIDATDEELEDVARRVKERGLDIGTVVAPVWPPTGGGPAAGSTEEVEAFLTQVRKGCSIGKRLRELGVRPNGVVRLDSATSVEDWVKDPKTNQSKIADTFKAAADIAEEYDERLAAEGEICWGGMHSWRNMVDLLERVGHPERFGFQADMAHTLLYLLGYNAPEDAILPQDFAWDDVEKKNAALKQLTHALRQWTIDFHVAQNDATVHGTGSHDKTGRHCLPDDPNGKLDIAHDAGFWLRDEHGDVLQTCRHICWDGCMFPNDVMHKPETWNSILSAMLSVQDAHGWTE
ncbi:MAG: TIM barrel protein [Planctomycetota bacterium]